jgi:hypothetical protein
MVKGAGISRKTLEAVEAGDPGPFGVDVDSGLVHSERGTSGNVNDVVEANSLLHGQEADDL